MAFLRNKNGIDYEILSSRNSNLSKGHKDFLVKSPNGNLTIVRGWKPKRKEWLASDFYGFGNDVVAPRLALYEFKNRLDERNNKGSKNK